MSRWADTSIGAKGEPLADHLAPLVEAWFAEIGADDTIDPRDLAHIASEVVFAVALERGLVAAYDRRYVSEIGKKRKL